MFKTMTQAEWNSCTDPEAMLNALCTSMSGKALDQQLRPIACGCVRRVWDELVDARGRRAMKSLSVMHKARKH
jgi:hypothetical protein